MNLKQQLETLLIKEQERMFHLGYETAKKIAKAKTKASLNELDAELEAEDANLMDQAVEDDQDQNDED